MIEIKPNIFYTGVNDFDLRVFDIIMETKYGTSYNSYVVKGSEKTALIEIAKANFWDEYIENVQNVVDIEKIDYLIVNHTEPDHAGSIEKLLDIAPHITVLGSHGAINFLKNIANRNFKSQVVKEGDTLSLGDKTLRFIMAPLLHWPDTMFTYVAEDKLLFTCDSFGAHYAGKEVFNDELALDEGFLDAYKYYFDMIMGPFKSFVRSALKKIEPIEIDMIAPGHGLILRENINKYLELYATWATEKKKENLVVISYVSAYGYTKEMAVLLEESLKSIGIIVKSYDLVELSPEKYQEMENHIAEAKGVLLGSPTLIGDALPPIYTLLGSLNPIIHKGIKFGAFGSFGWSGEAVSNLEDLARTKKFDIPVPGLQILFKASETEKNDIKNFGEAFGKAIL